MPLQLLGRVGAIAVLLLMATGCTVPVDGNVAPAPDLKPRPLHGDSAKQVLLDAGELTQVLGQSLRSDPDSPPRFGGRDMLFETRSSPADCKGVAFELQRSVYGSANIQKIGRESWWSTGAGHAKVISVSEVVVAVPTAKEATALFTKFSSQWQQCNGTTVIDSLSSGEPFMTVAISDVRTENSVVAATVKNRLSTTVVNSHALGVRLNCLVEAAVAYFTDHADDSAVDVAHRMMDKVSTLS
jgi:PknH-like protein